MACGSFYDAFSQFPELNMQNAQTQDEINTVLGIVKNGSDQDEVGFLLSLARNYYKLDNYVEAEKYYLQIINENICSDLDYKALAICLLNNDKNSLANEFFNIYRTRVKGNLNFQILWNQVMGARNQRILSSRVTATNYNTVYGNLDENGITWLNLDQGSVVAELQCNHVSNMSAVMLPVDDLNRIGSFTAGPIPQSYIYSYQENDGYYILYMAEMHKGKWRKPLRLDLGESMANYIHPFMVTSQNTLYFSSDKAGGFGGFDIYQVPFDGRSFTDDKNLGAVFNTDKNELLPSMYGMRITFTSNGHPGFGGYDILLCDKSLTSAELLNQPYNSNFNEFAIFSATETDALIIGGLKGETNIIDVRKIELQTKTISGKIVDLDGKPVNGAQVLFKYKKSNQGTFVASNGEGKFQVLLPDTIEDWSVQVIHASFKLNTFELKMQTLGNNTLIVSMEPVTIVEPEQVFIVNSPSKNVVPTTPVASQLPYPQSVNQRTENASTIFNEIGTDNGRYYVIFGSARSYVGAYDFWTKWQIKFPNAEILEYGDKGIFRVGEYAGTTHAEAMELYKRAKRIKTDVWILRPDLE